MPSFMSGIHGFFSGRFRSQDADGHEKGSAMTLFV
jgi:hypothetical protein